MNWYWNHRPQKVCWNMWHWDRKGAGHNLLKNDSHWRRDINWLAQTRSKMADDWLPLNLEPQYMLIVIRQQAKWHTHRRHDSSKTHHKRPKNEQWPNPWKSLPLPQNSWNNPPTHLPMKLPTTIKTDNPIPLSLWPSEMTHIQCVSPCISLLSLYYGSLLNYFLHEAKNPHSAAIPGTCLRPGTGRDHPLVPHFLSCNSMN